MFKNHIIGIFCSKKILQIYIFQLFELILILPPFFGTSKQRNGIEIFTSLYPESIFTINSADYFYFNIDAGKKNIKFVEQKDATNNLNEVVINYLEKQKILL